VNFVSVVVKMMLLLLLIFTVLLMALSMAVAISKARSEEKTTSGNLWIALSCLSILTVMGISYLMLTAPAPAAEAEAQTAKTQTANPQTAASQEVQGTSSSDGTGPAASASDASHKSTDQQAVETLESYDYLIEVLEAIKRGEPIPEKYLQMLPQTAPISDASPTSGNLTAAAPQLPVSPPGERPAQTPNQQSDSLKKPVPASGPNTNTPSAGSNKTSPGGADTNPPAANPKPRDPAKPALSTTSWISQTLQHDRNTVHDKFKYALPLEHSSEKEVYLTGEIVAEIRFTNDIATSIVLVMERLIPEGQSRDYWEKEFRQKAGMDASAPTSRSGMVSSWQNVYSGVNSIQFVIDLDNNRGLIQAH
jgi:hypothetical protein